MKEVRTQQHSQKKNRKKSERMVKDIHHMAETVFVEGEGVRSTNPPELTGRISYKEIADVIFETEINGIGAGRDVPQRYTKYSDIGRVLSFNLQDALLYIHDTPVLRANDEKNSDMTYNWGVSITMVYSLSTDEYQKRENIHPIVMEVVRRYREALRPENMLFHPLHYPDNQ